MTNEELAQRIEAVVTEMREAHRDLALRQDSTNARLDLLDFNGSAQMLRQFGHWLSEHPTFLEREAAEESERMRRGIALGWLADTLHLRDMRRKSIWLASSIGAGLLLAIGTDLYSLKPVIEHFLHFLLYGVR